MTKEPAVQKPVVYVEKRATSAINKNTIIKKTRTAANVPIKTAAASKAKKPMSAPSKFIKFHNYINIVIFNIIHTFNIIRWA